MNCLQNSLTDSTEFLHLLIKNSGKDHILVDDIAILAIVKYNGNASRVICAAARRSRELLFLCL